MLRHLRRRVDEKGSGGRAGAEASTCGRALRPLGAGQRSEATTLPPHSGSGPEAQNLEKSSENGRAGSSSEVIATPLRLVRAPMVPSRKPTAHKNAKCFQRPTVRQSALTVAKLMAMERRIVRVLLLNSGFQIYIIMQKY